MHTLRDLATDGSVKRLAFVQAMSKNGIGTHNINDLLEAVKDGTVNQALLNDITGDAALFLKDFYGTSNNSLLSRNRFSRRWMFNTMQ